MYLACTKHTCTQSGLPSVIYKTGIQALTKHTSHEQCCFPKSKNVNYNGISMDELCIFQDFISGNYMAFIQYFVSLVKKAEHKMRGLFN